MPIYSYRCPDDGVFEQYGGRDDDLVTCPCGQAARRLPFSSVPYIKGATVARSIPDPAYKTEAMRREHRAKGWDEDRAIRTMRKGLVEDAQGNKSLDMQKMTKE